MRVLIAPDSFKGTLSAPEAAAAMARGVDRWAATTGTSVEVRTLPVSDGGEGFAEAMTAALGGSMHHADLDGPHGERVRAGYGIWAEDGRSVAILEAASVIGLPLVPAPLRQPRRLTSFPLAGLIRAALRHNPQRIVLGVGGTATMDLGLGALEGLGAVPLGHRRSHVHASVGAIPQLTGFDVRPRSIAEHLATTRALTIACDVRNPLLGPTGAARTFGPQKGASAEDVERLETDFALFASRMRNAGRETDPMAAGMGAAGGIPYGFGLALNAEVRPGFDTLAEAIALDAALRWADVVMTGEGTFDQQSLHGKVVGALAERVVASGRLPGWEAALDRKSGESDETNGDRTGGRARREAAANATPVVVVAGRVAANWASGLAHDDPRRGAILTVRATPEGIGDETAFQRAAPLVTEAAEQAMARAVSAEVDAPGVRQ